MRFSHTHLTQFIWLIKAATLHEGRDELLSIAFTEVLTLSVNYLYIVIQYDKSTHSHNNTCLAMKAHYTVPH